jgi:small GTP-binding protein
MVDKTTKALSGPLVALRETEVDLLGDIAGTLAEMDEASSEDRKRLLEVARDLQEMFFLVAIIGEFNAGKSTFVNALLGDELLPMGITPTTEMIELVRYSETAERKPTLQGESLRVWAHPNTGAPGVAIVDTPGTGSIFRRHEETAMEFLHRSDMVIFLLSAKKAFAETERIYLEMAKNYGKKIILVMNQVDLLEPEEQRQVRRFIEQQVKESLGLQPLIFMVSAREALRAAKGLEAPRGGVDAVKAHLRGVFSEAPPAKQKMLAQLETANRIVKKYQDEIEDKASLIKSDTLKAREVQQELDAQSVGLDAQLKEARAEVDKVFQGMRQRGLNFIEANLSIRKITGTASREKLQAEFQDVVVGRAARDIQEATNGYINAVVDQSRSYWRSVIDRLNRLRDLLEQEITGLDANIYAEQREGLEEAIRIAEAELKTYSTGKMIENMRQEFEVNISGFRVNTLVGIGGLTVALIASVGTPGPLIGAGAAALALPAFVIAAPLAAFGGYRALRHYQRITNDLKKEFSERMDKLEATYYEALDDLTRKERTRLSQYGKQVLTPIFSRLEVLSKRYEEQTNKFDNYNRRIETLHNGIEGS